MHLKNDIMVVVDRGAAVALLIEGQRPPCTSLAAPFQRDNNPFVPCKISGNVSVCAGCRNKYPKNPNLPDEMCIKHKEWREYTPAGSTSPQARFGNTHYPFTPHCVWLRCPEFTPSLLVVSDKFDLG